MAALVTAAVALASVVVRTEQDVMPNGEEGFAIEDREGNILGYTSCLSGPEQRAAVAKAMGVEDEGQVAYKGDDEDENGPVEVWGLRGVPVPTKS